MPNRQYILGTQRERNLVEWYWQRGWWATRAPGSHGAADVVALKAGEQPHLVQLKAIKGGGTYRGFGPKDRIRLKADARRSGAIPIFCSWVTVSEEPQFYGEDEWPADTPQRQKADYVVDSRFGCWLWQKSTVSGYGRCGRGGKLVMAHRWYYEQAKGPIPDGLEIDHLCRVRSCVNPDHLEAVTREENIRRSPIAKLTEEQVLEIRMSKESNAKLGIIYGVTRDHVAIIRKGKKNWRDVA